MSSSHLQRACLRLPGGHHTGDSLMRAERLPCWLSTPPLRLICLVHRDREERPITSVAVAYYHFLSSLPRPLFAFALFPHTIIYLFIPFSVFLFATLIFFSPDLSGKKRPKWRWRRGQRHAKWKTQRASRQRVAAPSPARTICSARQVIFTDMTDRCWSTGRLVDESNLPTDCLCKCRSSCLAHVTEWRGWSHARHVCRFQERNHRWELIGGLAPRYPCYSRSH